MADALERVATDPMLNELHVAVVQMPDRIGTYVIEDGKGSYLIRNGRAFLGVHPRRGGLLVNIVLDRSVESDRMVKVERVSRSRVHNEVILGSLDAIDTQLEQWVREAHDLTVAARSHQ